MIYGSLQHVWLINTMKLLRIQMIPTLAALLLATRVPDYAQHLLSPVGEIDKILLQGVDAEGIADRKLL